MNYVYEITAFPFMRLKYCRLKVKTANELFEIITRQDLIKPHLCALHQVV